MPNFRLRIDGMLGMVVVEFCNDAGEVAESIPTPRELRAYRAAALTNAPLPPATQSATAPEHPVAVVADLYARPPAAPAAPPASGAPAAAPGAIARVTSA